MLRVGEVVFPGNAPLKINQYLVFNPKIIHIQATLNKFSRLYLCVGVLMNLRGSTVGAWVGLERGKKEGDKWCNFILIKKYKFSLEPIQALFSFREHLGKSETRREMSLLTKNSKRYRDASLSTGCHHKLQWMTKTLESFFFFSSGC